MTLLTIRANRASTYTLVDDTTVYNLVLDDTQLKELIYNLRKDAGELLATTLMELQKAELPPEDDADQPKKPTIAKKDVDYEASVKDAEEEKLPTTRAAERGSRK